jgi:uncharacterized protein (DUF4415 family)
LQEAAPLKKGFFTRYGRPESAERLAPDVVPRAEGAAGAASGVADIVRGIASKGLPRQSRKAVISLRIDREVLDWFKAQGPGYQTRMNAVLRAYREAAAEPER